MLTLADDASLLISPATERLITNVIGVSTANAYLNHEILARPNLTVGVKAQVDRILFEEDESGVPRAVGIELSTHPGSPRYRVRADREVILSSGSIGSPKILLLSGVGPAADLQKLNIPVVKDLPAGQYLSDVGRHSPLKTVSHPAPSFIF